MEIPMSSLLITSARLLDRSLKPANLAMTALLLGAGFAIWMAQGLRGGETTKPGEITTSVDAPASQVGASGLPIPRFVSLKANKVNVRKGPSSDHAVAWVFQRKGLPVEIVAEFENWRKIRDSDGQEGWILQQMLSGRRFAMAQNWDKQRNLALHNDASGTSATIAILSPGVLTQVESCTGEWCYVSVEDHEGYALQTELWGVYPGEVVD
jgi:SH3-like domain-containing protein